MADGHGLVEVEAEIALSTDPLTRPGPGDWTTFPATLPLRHLTIARGAPQKIPGAAVESGTADFEVDDAGRQLDTGNPLSSWYTALQSRRRIRFRVLPEGATGALAYTGFTDEVEYGWMGQTGESRLTTNDVLGATSQTLPPSVLHAEIVAMAPQSYHPLAEASGIYADDVIGVLDGEFISPIESKRIAPYDLRSSAVFRHPDTADTNGQRMDVYPYPPSRDLSAWWLFQYDRGAELHDAQNPIMVRFRNGDRFSTGNNRQVYCYVAPIGDSVYLAFRYYDGAASCLLLTDPVEVLDGAAHTIGFDLDDADNFRIIVDDIELGWFEFSGTIAALNLGALLDDITVMQVGWGIGYNNAEFVPTSATIGHVAVWDRRLDRSEYSTLHAAAMSAWDGDLTGARIEKVLDLLNVDPADRDIDAGVNTCGPTSLDVNSVEYLADAVRTEGGSLFVNPDGVICFRERTANDPTVVLTISDDPSGDSGIPYAEEARPVRSKDRVVNVANVTREGGSEQQSVNSTSVGVFGERPVTVDTLHRTASGARSTGAQIVHRNGELRTVFPDVVIEGRDGGVDADALLALELGDAVRMVARAPVGDPTDVPVALTERITHTFTNDQRWRVGLKLAEHTVLPLFAWDDADQGWDASVWEP